MSFEQPAEMADKNPDAEILAAIDEIEFDFGRDRFTTAQAELLFTYEIELDIDRPYVIALSENCGTVIFYIPDDLKRRIVERAVELDCSANMYLAYMVEFRWAASAAILARWEPEPVNEFLETKSNNWLKMHGFPMRRKGKGRKHHE